MKISWMSVVTFGLAIGAATAAPEVPTPVLSKDEKPAAVKDKPAEPPAAEPAATNAPAAEPKTDVHAAELEKLSRDLKSTAGSEAPEDKITLAGRFVFPSDAAWKQAFGGEAQWRRWRSPTFGFALAAGIQTWKLENKQLIVHDSDILNPMLDGSATVVPLGASLLFRREPKPDTTSVLLDLGLRYALISSDANVTYEYIDHYGNHRISPYPVDFDNRLLAVAAIEIGGQLGDDAEWFVTGGYQFDFTSGENWLYEEVANDFGGATVGAGIRWRL